MPEMRSYIVARCMPEPNSGCWLWLQSTGSHKYPQAWNGKKVVLAHRAAYEAFVGDIPQGFDVDHKCRNRMCVNPEHLEATTPFANRRRQFGYVCDATSAPGTCPKGHEYKRSNGKLYCLTCTSERAAAKRHQLSA